MRKVIGLLFVTTSFLGLSSVSQATPSNSIEWCEIENAVRAWGPRGCGTQAQRYCTLRTCAGRGCMPKTNSYGFNVFRGESIEFDHGEVLFEDANGEYVLGLGWYDQNGKLFEVAYEVCED